jgi:hypothetical protein
MDENILKQLWLNSNQVRRIEINSEKLMETINQKVLHMDKIIKKRDGLEIFIAICMMPLFVWWLITSPQLLARIGVAIIAGACLLVILKLVSARRVCVREEIASATQYHLMVSLLRVQKQIRLLSTVLWWYFLPFFIGVVCLFYSYSITFTSKAVYTIVVAALYGYIYYLNKRALKKHLKPLEGNIKKALYELLSEE